MDGSDVKEVPKPILQKRRPKINRETKAVLIFDEEARRQYLTGFQKRKNERRLKAKLENKQKEKEEKRALKQKMREMAKKVAERCRIPEVEEFLESTVYDDDDHTITITDLSSKSRTSTDSNTDQQNIPQDEGGEDGDTASFKKEKKKLIHRLANVGNSSTSKNKVKRLGTRKLKRTGGKHGSKSLHRGGGHKQRNHNKKRA